MNQFEAIRLFREAQSRANNVARDLHDLDWTRFEGQMNHVNLEEQLKEIHKETKQTLGCLAKLLEK